MKKLLACLVVLLMLGGVFGVAYAQDIAVLPVDGPMPQPPLPIPAVD